MSTKHSGIGAWCVHYQRKPGLPRNEACKAGVVYDELTKVKELGLKGCMLRLPCIRRHHDQPDKDYPICECLHLRWPTKEEIEADEKDTEEMMAKHLKALAAIKPLRAQHKGKNWSGKIECPVCKGELHVRHSGYNNHVWAQCQTKECVSWIE